MKIQKVDILQIDLAPKVKRTDAIQSFVTQETPMVRVTCDDGAIGRDIRTRSAPAARR
jgi:hypothetical protein